MTRFVLVAAVFILFVGAIRAQDYMVPCGEITGMELKDSIDEDDITWDARLFGPKPTLEGSEKFAVITITMDENKSIGKRDFTLALTECLAISKTGTGFDPDEWEYKDLDAGANVRLLFKVDGEDDNGDGYTLTYKYADQLRAAYAGEKSAMVNQTISTKVGSPDDEAVDPMADDDDGDDDGDDDDDPPVKKTRKNKPAVRDDGDGEEPKKKPEKQEENWEDI